MDIALPLSKVHVGTLVRIRRLTAEEPICQRLREIGFCEERVVRLITNQSTVICQVCQSRLAISVTLAEQILVEPVSIPEAA